MGQPLRERIASENGDPDLELAYDENSAGSESGKGDLRQEFEAHRDDRYPGGSSLWGLCLAFGKRPAERAENGRRKGSHSRGGSN